MVRRSQTAFGDYLDHLLGERRLTVSAFARLVGVPPSSVSTVKRFTLNPQRIGPWADALGLKGQRRERFFELAHLAHAPAPVQDLVQRLRATIVRLEAENAVLGGGSRKVAADPDRSPGA